MAFEDPAFTPVALAEEEEDPAFTPVALAEEEEEEDPAFTPVGFAEDEEPVDTRRIRGEAFGMLKDARRLSPRVMQTVADEDRTATGGVMQTVGAIPGSVGEALGNVTEDVLGGPKRWFGEKPETAVLNEMFGGKRLDAKSADDIKAFRAGVKDERTAETLDNFIQFFEGNGVTDGKQMMTLLKDSIRENTWDPTTDDKARVLSDGTLRVNPKFVALPDANEGIAAIMAAPVDDATRQQEVANFKAARKTAAAALDTKTKAFHEGYRTYAEAQAAKGITDPEQVFYSWPGLDRGFIETSWDVIRDTVAEAGRGTANTVRGLAMGLAEATGATDDVERIGRDMLASSEKSRFVSEIAAARGQEGAVLGTGKELGTTVLEMVPMFAGGAAGRLIAGGAEAGAARKLLGSITAGTSVYGYTGAQGYSSVMQQALATAQREATQQGRELTGAEIDATVDKFQGAALANGLQMMVAAKLLNQGVEAAALKGFSAQAGQMTGRDVLAAARKNYGEGGLRAAVMATRPELEAFAKQAYKAGKVGFKDEAIEEGVTQFLEGTIVKLSGADPDKTWDQIGQETWKGTWMGGVVGSGLPVAMKAFASPYKELAYDGEGMPAGGGTTDADWHAMERAKMDHADMAEGISRQLAAGAQFTAPAAAEAAMEPLAPNLGESGSKLGDQPRNATPRTLGTGQGVGTPLGERLRTGRTTTLDRPADATPKGSEPAAGILSTNETAPLQEPTATPTAALAEPAVQALPEAAGGVAVEPAAAGGPVAGPDVADVPVPVAPPPRVGSTEAIWTPEEEARAEALSAYQSPILESLEEDTLDRVAEQIDIKRRGARDSELRQKIRGAHPDDVQTALETLKLLPPTDETTPLPPEPAAPPVTPSPAEAPVPAADAGAVGGVTDGSRALRLLGGRKLYHHTEQLDTSVKGTKERVYLVARPDHPRYSDMWGESTIEVSPEQIVSGALQVDPEDTAASLGYSGDGSLENLVDYLWENHRDEFEKRLKRGGFAYDPDDFQAGDVLDGLDAGDASFKLFSGLQDAILDAAESGVIDPANLAYYSPAGIRPATEAQTTPVQGQTETPQPVGAEAAAPVQDKTAAPQPYSPAALKATFALSAEEAVAVDALVQAMGLDTSRIQLQRGGTPGAGAMAQDSDYLAAVERGDMATAQRMVEEAAFAAGYTIGPIHHGTLPSRGDFDVFRNGITSKDGFRLNFDGLGPGWFSSDKEQASKMGDRVISGYIRLEKPWTLYADEFALDEHIERRKEWMALTKKDRDESHSDPVKGWWIDGLTWDERNRLKELTQQGAGNEIVRGDSFEALERLGKEAQIEFPDLSEGEAIRRGLQAQGYDGIIFEATNADSGSTPAARLWVVPFDGGNQIKSADPVTYEKETQGQNPAGTVSGGKTVIPLSQRFNPASPSILYQDAPVWTRETFESLPDQSKKNIAINIVEYGWDPANYAMTDADVQTWAAEGLAKRAARLAKENAAEARSRAVLENSKTAPAEATLVTEADLRKSQLEDDGYFYHVTTPAGAKEILKSRRIASGKRQSMAEGYYAEYSRGKVFFTDRGGVGYWQGKISDHLEAQGRSGKTVVIRIPKHAVGDLKVDGAGTQDARAPAWFSPENVLFQNQQDAKGSFEQLPGTGDILLRGLASPDVSTAVHEIAHAARRTILNREIPAEARAGITDADIAATEEWAGATDGVWSVAAEEKFARGLERYFRDGKAPVAALQGVFDKLGAWLQDIYRTVAGSPLDIEISDAMRAVFDKLVSRGVVAAPPETGTTPGTSEAQGIPAPLTGGNPPSASESAPANTTSIKNEATDLDLARYGFDPIIGPTTKSEQDTLDEARSAVAKDPSLPDTIIERVVYQGGVVSTDVENGVLLDELARRKITQGKLQSAYFRLVDSGASEVDIATARATLDKARDAVHEAIKAAKLAGTQAGRLLQSRKKAIDNDDFSIVAMEARYRTEANDGKPLSDEQIKKVAELAKQAQQWQARAEAAERLSEEQFLTIERLTADVEQAQKKAAARNAQPALKAKIKSKLTPAADAARARIAARNAAKGGPDVLFQSGLDPDAVAHMRDIAIILAERMVDGAFDLAKATEILLREFGDVISGHAKWIHDEASRIYQETVESVTGEGATTPQQVVDAIDPNEEITKEDVWASARAHVIVGARGAAVLDNVHADLSAIFPDLTRDRVAELFTDYGKESYPSQNETAAELRRIKSLERIALKITDVREGNMPKRTGAQRDEPDAEIRELEKQFREEYRALEESMRAKGIPFEDSKRRLKTALGAVKRRMQNEIEEIERAIASKQARAKREKVTFDTDPGYRELKQRLDAKRAEYAEVFRSEPDRLQLAKDSASKSLDRYLQMLVSGNTAVEKKPPGPTDAELEQLRSLRDTFAKQVAEARRVRPTADEIAKKERDAALTAAEKTLAELERKITENDIAAKTKGQPRFADDAEITAVRDQISAARETLKEMRKAALPVIDPVQARIDAAIRALDRQIAEEQQMLADGVLKKAQGQPVTSPEIETRRDRLRQMRQNRRDLYAAQNPGEIEATALAAAKTAAQKAIDRLGAAVASGDVAVKKKDPAYTPDAELLALIESRETLSDMVAEMRRALPFTPAQEAARETRMLAAAEKTLKNLEDKLANNDLSVRSQPPGSMSPRVMHVRNQIKEINRQLDERRKDAKVGPYSEASRVARFLASSKLRIADYNRRMAARDFAARRKPEPLRDDRAKAATHELNIIKRKFNSMVLEDKLSQRGLVRKIADNSVDVVLRLPRAALASLDVSGIGRQSWLLWATRPKLAFDQFPKHFKWSERAADVEQAKIEADADYDIAVESGLGLTSWRPGHQLYEMEEQYRSRLAKSIPGISHSERGYVTYLNAIRMTYFKTMVGLLRQRPDGMTRENLKSLANHVNNMTGRGSLGKKWDVGAQVASDIFFAPRWVASRVRLIGGLVGKPIDALTGFRLGPKETRLARKLIVQEHARTYVGVTVLSSLLAFAARAFGDDDDEVRVGTDVTSSDFGKLIIGEQRFDFSGGMLSPFVFLARMALGRKTKASGEVVSISGTDKEWNQSRGALVLDFARKKLSPTAGFVVNRLTEKDVFGKPVYIEDDFVGLYIPLPISEGYEAFRKQGLSPAAASSLALNFFGFSNAVYGQETDATYTSSASKDFNTGVMFPVIRAVTGGKLDPDPARYDQPPDFPLFR